MRPTMIALIGAASAAAGEPPIPAETPEQAKARHERVVERRKGVDIICHRGASEHAHENTLEAFRATFEVGGDGNEFESAPPRTACWSSSTTTCSTGSWRPTAT